MIYDVDYKRLALMLTPLKLRRGVLMGLLYVLMSGVESVAGWFKRYREETDYDVRHNGQVCHLQGMLNDYFDRTSRRIAVGDAEEMEAVLLYKRTTGLERIIKKRNQCAAVMIPQRAFAEDEAVRFTIDIPAALNGQIDESRMKALTGKYKLASMRYKIRYV